MMRERSPAADTMMAELQPWYCVRFQGRCNLKCFYCYEQRPAGMPSDLRSRIERDLELASDLGYRTAVFESGELLLIGDHLHLVRFAKKLFRHVLMVSNLTVLVESNLRELAEAGMDGIAGTIFAFSEEESFRIAGSRDVHRRQLRALEAIARQESVSFWPHLMLTRSTMNELPQRLELVLKMAGGNTSAVMLSAIEPINDRVMSHHEYTDALEFGWEEFLSQCDELGIYAVVQNLPACVLGRWAHRSFIIRKRVGRLLEGMPSSEPEAAMVRQWESLRCRVPLAGPCVTCRLVGVCHRFYDYRVKRPDGRLDERAVVRAMMDEMGLSGDAERIAEELRGIESDNRTGLQVMPAAAENGREPAGKD